MQAFTRLLSEITADDLAIAGKKATMLGKLFREQDRSPLKVPQGFVVTATAYNYFVSYNNLQEKLCSILNTVNTNDYESITDAADKCRKLIVTARVPRDLEVTLTGIYSEVFSGDKEVAVRNSITGNNVPNGVADTYLNIRGPIALIYAIKCCFASLYSEKAIAYRMANPQESMLDMAVLVQQMVRSDIGASGTVCIKNNQAVVKSTLGLGEILGTTEVEPDVFEFSINASEKTLIKKIKGKKGRMSAYADNAAGTNSTWLRITPAQIRDDYAISEDDALHIISYALPEDNCCFEWAKDGITNIFYLINNQ